ncbi:RidA family protein [Streptomyces sp. NPDC058572]|uniref:RidA family protein n=1 Tax=Streptomyces sp. NPDC058572 TaxID=3346546 RepID=UPI00364FE4D2
MTVVRSGRTAFRAGQCRWDPSGTLVGEGGLGRQIDQVAAGAMTALAAVDAAPDQTVRSVAHAVSGDTELLAAAWRRPKASPLGPAFTTASPGVAQLGSHGQLVERDLTAALPA